MTSRILILGGTSEASRLARRIAEAGTLDAIVSFAGRTLTPAHQALPTRIGGFGGIDGLRAFLRNERITRVVDATHPFAAQMSRHATAACAAETVPLLVLTRPPWVAGTGDRWIGVPDAAAAAVALGTTARRVFLTVGRLSLRAFAAAPMHDYLIRTIDRPHDLSFLPQARLHLARPPFSLDAERDLLRQGEIDVLVTKNSGGEAAAAKLAAAREVGLPVIVIERPTASIAPTTFEVDRALAFVHGND